MNCRFQNYDLIVLEAVKNNPLSLAFASSRLADNLEITMISVRINGLALKYVSKNLRNQYNIVKEAIKN